MSLFSEMEWSPAMMEQESRWAAETLVVEVNARRLEWTSTLKVGDRVVLHDCELRTPGTITEVWKTGGFWLRLDTGGARVQLDRMGQGYINARIERDVSP
jgi:hypothetical protein